VVILQHGDREVLTALLDCLFAFLPIGGQKKYKK
jgi:hypothetical protein